MQVRFAVWVEGTPWEKYHRFKEFLAYKTKEDFQFQSSYVHDNLFFNPAKPFILPARAENGIMDSSGKLVIERSIAAKEGPGFTDYKNRDFNLKNDARLFSLIPGFKPGDFSRRGWKGIFRENNNNLNQY